MATWNPQVFEHSTGFVNTKSVESQFLCVYKNVVNNMIQSYALYFTDVANAIEELKTGSFAEIDMSKTENTVAYIMCYATGQSVLAHNHSHGFLEFYGGKLPELGEVFKIVSFSVGSGNDILGFLSALLKHRRRPSKMNVTMVGKSRKFHVLFSAQLTELSSRESFKELGTFLEYIDINYEFIEADMRKCDDIAKEEIKNKVNDADIILMTGYVDVFGDNLKYAMDKTIRWMKEGALIYLCDREVLSVCDLRKYGNISQVYGKYGHAVIGENTGIWGIDCVRSARGHAEIWKKYFE